MSTHSLEVLFRSDLRDLNVPGESVGKSVSSPLVDGMGIDVLV